MQAVVILQILILQLLLHFCFSSMHVSQFCVCDFFILCRCSNARGTLLLHCLTQKAKESRCLYESRAQRHCNTSPIQLTLPNIHVDVVSSDHRVYSNNDSTSDSNSHVIACDDFTRSRNLVIGYFADITAGQRN